MTAQKSANNRIETEVISQEGPIAYVESTTLSKIFGEDANRMILYTTDETPEQTRRILQAEGKRRKRQVSSETQAVIDKHHAAQRLLASLSGHVIVPFAEELAEVFPSERVEARRAFRQLLSLIQSISLLHAYQRDLDEKGFVIANLDDYDIARDLLSRSLARSLGGGISDGARRLYWRLVELYEDGTFGEFKHITVPLLRQHSDYSDESLRGWMAELNEASYAVIKEYARGSRPKEYALTDKEMDKGLSEVLPTRAILEAKVEASSVSLGACEQAVT